jgi:hypothetical protein
MSAPTGGRPAAPLRDLDTRLAGLTGAATAWRGRRRATIVRHRPGSGAVEYVDACGRRVGRGGGGSKRRSRARASPSPRQR